MSSSSLPTRPAREPSRDRSATARPLPAWVAPADRLLARAMRETKLLGVATPLDAAAERARLVGSFEAGRATPPRWSYAPMDGAAALERALDDVAIDLERDGAPLALAYAARARELAAEVATAGAVGSSAIGARARLRFAADPSDAARAAAIATAWLAIPAVADPPLGCASDADDPSSLLRRMREEVGRHRLPFNVIAQRSLVPLAATGERTIWIAAGRALSRDDVERTVLHEIEGHARPRARAIHQPLGLFGLGTARGSDHQEGLALRFEEARGFLQTTRKRELAFRHRVVEQMDAGASFVDVVLGLIGGHGLPARRAVALAERAFRGGDGQVAGLGRERVYLPSFVRVGAHLDAHPEDERVLASGQVAVDAVALLAGFLESTD